MSIHLKFDEMPVSFTGKALMWGATNDILNPINEGQGKINRFLGKPARLILRLTYQIGVAAIAPFGALYHTFMGLGYWGFAKLDSHVKAKRSANDLEVIKIKKTLSKKEVTKIQSLATAHFKAALMDFCSFISIAGVANFILSQGVEEPFCMNPNDSDVANMLFLPSASIIVPKTEKLKNVFKKKVSAIAFNKYFCIKLEARENASKIDAFNVHKGFTYVHLKIKKTIQLTADEIYFIKQKNSLDRLSKVLENTLILPPAFYPPHPIPFEFLNDK